MTFTIQKFVGTKWENFATRQTIESSLELVDRIVKEGLSARIIIILVTREPK